MKILKGKTFSVIALSVLMTSAFFAFGINLTQAATIVQYLPTYARISPVPSPVGAGQQMLISFGLQPVPPVSSLTAASIYEWNNMRINVVKPNGQNDTLGPFISDPTGSTFTTYVPKDVGTYTFQLVFPGQWMNYTSGGTTYNNYYFGSVSLPAQGQVTVQQDWIPNYPDVPLPTGYWTVPLYGEMKGAPAIMDNWLMAGYDYTSRSFTISSTFSPYTSAPNSSHVLWTTPIKIGGAMGGQFGARDYYTGLAYEQFYSPLIVQGQIIYSDHGLGSATTYGTRCLDLYTGKQLWYLENVTFAFAQVVEIDTPNEHGGLAYLWTTSGFGANQTWQMYEPFSSNTGEPPRLVCTVTNVTAGSASRRGAINLGPNGEILAYYLSSSTSRGNWMTMWNSTLAILGPPGPAVATWSPVVGRVYNGAVGIQWNVTLPNFTQPIAIMEANGGYVLASNASGISLTYAQMQMAFPAILNRDPGTGAYPTTLAPLWVAERSCYMSSYKFSNVNNGVYAMFDEETSVLQVYDVATGAKRFFADPLTTPFGIFSGYGLMVAYNNVYEIGYDGHVRAYDVTTGKLNWDFYQGSAGFETPYGSWPAYAGVMIADGKVFYSNDEHSPDANLWRGGEYICLNATTGDVIFRVSGQLHEGAISDGYYTASNNYDGLAYCFGKGPSKTTVSAPQTLIPKGTGVLITGSITDQSPGKPGTPCVSHDSMSAWMEYLYQQKPRPTDVTGVPIQITVIDPNGNYHALDTVTSDIGGNFATTWNPPVEGTYQVTATFAGDDSYGDSYATTYFAVAVAPSASAVETPTPTIAPVSPTPTLLPTQSPTPSASVPPPPPSEFPWTTVYISVAAVVIIAVVAAVALVLRRRK